MHRLNLTIDEVLYERARAVSFLEKKSISKIIRESLNEYLNNRTKNNPQTELILEAKDEEEVRKILAQDSFVSDDVFREKFGL